MKKQYLFLLFIGLLFVSCTAPSIDIAACVEATPSGFWEGLWHGIIAPFTFIVSLFVDTIELYDINNNGGWYNFGFVLGAGILFGGSSSGVGRSRRRNK